MGNAMSYYDPPEGLPGQLSSDEEGNQENNQAQDGQGQPEGEGQGAAAGGQQQEQQQNEEAANGEAHDPNDDDDFEYGESEEHEDEVQEEIKHDEKDGCVHYKRKCSKKCPECKEIFPCRRCHDEVHFEKELDPKKNHQIDRHAVTEIRCNYCQKEQPASNKCVGCGIEFAGYYCDVCKFWDDDFEKKEIFHCEGCGICRVGGRENFFHCEVCECCLPLSQKNSHRCLRAKQKQDCPVCLEDMHTSTKGSIEIRCGHMMHKHCFYQYQRTQIGCPLCKKSIVDPKLYEQFYDQQIALTKMPEEYKDTKMVVICNDCSKKSIVPFHIVGGKCSGCRSYNTARIENEKQEMKLIKEQEGKERETKEEAKEDDEKDEKKGDDDEWDDVE